MILTPDDFHRLGKLLIDTGEAQSLEEAERELAEMRLQVHVGADVAGDRALQAALLTAINAGRRAFLGGVNILLEADGSSRSPWGSGSLSAAVHRYGGSLVTALDETVPTLVMGHAERELSGSPIVHAKAASWVGVATDDPGLSLVGTANVLGAILAAGLGVSELFQNARGYPVAGERTIGLSLWRPDLAWHESAALGPKLEQLPQELWLVGLGHLGQASAWILGCLPYADRSEVVIYVQDADHLVDANLGTSMLATPADLGIRKARVVAAALDQLGFQTAIIERDLDPSLRVTTADPPVSLVGVDNPTTRHWLSGHRWKQVIDAGLGADARDYLGIDVRDLASDDDSTEIWPLTSAERDTERLEAQPGYRRLLEETGDQCGVQLLAGRAVATAFVGVIAAAQVIGAACRPGHPGGRRYRLTSLHLRNPESLEALPHGAPESLPVSFQPVGPD